MKYHIPIFLLLFSTLFSFDRYQMDKLANKIGFQYKLPENIQLLPVYKTDNLPYQIAFKNKYNIEIRFAAFDNQTLPSGMYNATDNRNVMFFYTSFTSMLAHNITQDKKIDLSFKSLETASSVFNGDFGNITVVKGNSQFSYGYKYVSMATIYKKNRGMIVIYILFNDVGDFDNYQKSKEFQNEFYFAKFLN